MERFALLTLVLAGVVAGARSHAADKDEQMFQENCSLCHSLDRPRAQRHTRDEWRGVIEKMVGLGCPIGTSKKAQAAVLDYLVRTQGLSATSPQAPSVHADAGAH